MSKIITDDCMKSFITNHYGKTSIAGIGDGTVTGAISALNTSIQNHMNMTSKPNKDILNINGEAMNKWYWVSTSDGHTNFPKDTTYGAIKYLSPASGVIICILISNNHAISTNVYNDGKWGNWNCGSNKETTVIKRSYYYQNKTFSSYGVINLDYTPPAGYERLGFVNIYTVGAVGTNTPLYVNEGDCTDSKIAVWNAGPSITVSFTVIGLYCKKE